MSLPYASHRGRGKGRLPSMIRLAMLLIGTQALRRKWGVLAAFGLLWMALGLAIMADAADRVSMVTTEAFAVLLLFEGFIALSYFTLTPLLNYRNYRAAPKVRHRDLMSTSGSSGRYLPICRYLPGSAWTRSPADPRPGAR